MSFTVHSVLRNRYRYYYDRFCKYVVDKVRDAQLAEEIVTETFTTIMTKEDRLGDKKQIVSYLYSAIDETCKTHRTQKRIEQTSIDDLEQPLSLSSNVEDRIEADFRKSIWEQIEKLPPQRRQILKQLYQEGLTSREVAERMRLSRQTVINQKVRAFKILRKIISGCMVL